jgi:hypothetical protein
MLLIVDELGKSVSRLVTVSYDILEQTRLIFLCFASHPVRAALSVTQEVGQVPLSASRPSNGITIFSVSCS